MSRYKNEGVYSGEIIAKEQKVKDGRVWGYFWTVAQMGEALDFNVGEADYDKANIGDEVGVKYRLSQRNYRLYANVSAVQTVKQSSAPAA